MKSILARASSIFLPFEMTNSPHGLPDDLLERCSNLRVLILSYCAFNFLSPLFRHCHTLKFLGLDHCRNNYTTDQLVEREDYNGKWACLYRLLVLDLRYTDWDELLSDKKLDLMGNIMELNVEGSMCWQYTGQLEGRLAYLERLRIVKLPLREADTSMEIDYSCTGKTKLEVVDLCGNKDMKNLPTSLSKASNLQVLVLDGLENVVLSNTPSVLMDMDRHPIGLPQETSRPKFASKDVKTFSLITLKGCTQLKNLFLRGLPNLVELDLSGCAIKILGFETMVVDVPRLKRLFLLGCVHLCAIRWSTHIDPFNDMRMPVDLELLCIDTRSRDGRTGPFTAYQPANNSFGFQVHAITADARLVRSLWTPINHHAGSKESWKEDVFFDIRITSSNIICDDEKSSEGNHVVAAASLNDDVCSEILH
jgi:hypothetical protein